MLGTNILSGYSPAGRKNITLFDCDPLSGAIVSDDIQIYRSFQLMEEC